MKKSIFTSSEIKNWLLCTCREENFENMGNHSSCRSYWDYLWATAFSL